MRRYFDGGPARVINRQRPIFSLDKTGFITSCDLLVKVNPCLDDGLEVVGVLSVSSRESEGSCSVLVDANNWTLAGVSKRCYSEYGVHPWLSYGLHPDNKPLSFKDLFFKGESIDNIGNLNQDSSKYMIDTRKIKKGNYLQSHIWKMKNLPPLKLDAFTRQPVKLELTDSNSYGIPDLNTMVVRIVPIKSASAIIGTYMRNTGSKLGIDSMHQLQGENIMTKASLKKKPQAAKCQKPSKFNKKSIESISAKDESSPDLKDIMLEESDDNEMVSEEEIERVNAEAEKERRLREQKSNLTGRVRPSYIMKVYLLTSTMIFMSVGSCIALFIIQTTRNRYFSQGVDTLFNMNLINSYMPMFENYALTIKDKYEYL